MADAAPFTISRVLQAPRELVYQVHTDPAHLARWMSPEGFESIHARQEFRVGGTYHYGLRGPGGLEMWGKQVYLEIVPPEKIVLLQSFSDRNGGLARHPMSPSWPLEMLATTTFEALGAARCRVTIRWQPHQSDPAGHAAFDGARPGMTGGFEGTLKKLEAYLASLQEAGPDARGNETSVEYPSDTEMVFARVFEAPRALVWKAHVTPGMVEQWWGPAGFTNTTHEMSVKPGGVWRLTMHGPDGTGYPNTLTYLEVKPEERLRYDHGDFERVHFRVTTDFIAEGPSRTRLVTRMVFPSKVSRDETARFAVDGHASTMGRLEAFLPDLGRRLDWELRIERTLLAPRARVFEAWSRPESVSLWFAPKGLTVPVCEMEFRQGGAWKLCMRMPDGSDHWMTGRYLEIRSPEKLVWESTLSGQPPGHRIHTTVDFIEEGGRTRLKVHQVYTGFAQKLPSEAGWTSTLENLAAHVAAS
jgi:uncharacterized protein YndB with AHSA1/START domain